MHRKLLVIILALLLIVGGAQAQGEMLEYGSNTQGTISTENPLALYIFQGNAGDWISIDVLAISGLDAAVSLNGPAQQQIAHNDNDATRPGSTDAHISTILNESGVYTILISGSNSSNGDFLLRLSAQAGASTLPQAPASMNFGGVSSTQAFTLPADSAPRTLTLTSNTPGFAFVTSLYNATGSLVALMTSDTGFSLNIPGGGESYQVVITALDPSQSATVNISVTGGNVAVPATEPQTTGQPQTQVSDSVCSVSAQGAATTNVRTGPGTDFGILSVLSADQRLEVTGVYNTWYRVNVPGAGTGWVRQDVIIQYGPCNTVSVVDASQVPQAAQQPAAPTAVPQQPVEQPTQAPAQQQPTQQPAQQATTVPPTVAAQIAPADSNYVVNIDLDENASASDAVSYPNGDTEDVLSWNISGMNPSVALPGGRARVVVTVSCFGTGTDQVQIRSGVQTYNCGQIVYDREITYDQRSGTIRIAAVGGSDTYVQWSANINVTRIN